MTFKLTFTNTEGRTISTKLIDVQSDWDACMMGLTILDNDEIPTAEDFDVEILETIEAKE